jgi:hypothetical protein
MTVKELREILSNGIIPDDLIITSYDDTKIRDVNLTIEADGTVSEIRLGMIALD